MNKDFKMGGQQVITFDRFIRGLIGLCLVCGVAVLIYWLRAVLVPFFVAWVIAYLLYPCVRFLQRRCRIRSRLVAITLTLLLTGGAVGGFLYITVPPMMEECSHLKDVALRYVQQGTRHEQAIPEPVQRFFRQHANEYQLENLLQQEDVMAAIKSAVPKVWQVLMSTASLIVNIIASLIGLLYLLFLLTDYEKYANGWITFVPRKHRRIAARLVGDIENGMAGYFRGQALIALSNCVMFSVGFLLIDFPMPIALGCFIGVISFVPYLQVVGMLPATVLALLKAAETGQNFWVIIGLVLLVYVVVQILQDTIFTPRIMGKIMGLPPAIILLVLSVWGYALGIAGLILALPVTTLAISYYRHYVVGDDDVNTPPDAEAIAIEKEAGIYLDELKEQAAQGPAPEASAPADPTLAASTPAATSSAESATPRAAEPQP